MAFSNQPYTKPDGTPTVVLIRLLNALRKNTTDPYIHSSTKVVNDKGYPTRPLIVLMGKLTGDAPDWNNAVVDPDTGYPTKAFLRMVNP